MHVDCSEMNLEAFCRMLNESQSTTFVLKRVKVTKAERKKGLALIGVPPKVSGLITVIAGGEKREYTIEASDFEIYGD